MALPVLFRTSVFQLTILYVVLFGVSVVALGGFVYWSTVGYLQRQTEEVIMAELEGLLGQFQIGIGIRGLATIINERVKQTGEETSVYLLVEPNNLEPIAGNLRYWPREFDQPNQMVQFSIENPGGNDIPVLAYVTAPSRQQPGYRLLVGREIRELEQLQRTFRRASILGLGLTMSLALAGGLALAWSAQRRVAQLNRTTRQIIAGDLSQRVPVSGYHDEHAELAESVNTMLDQIESLLVGLRHVGDSIAHDLRGPLTRLRTRLEALANEEQPSRASVRECLEQADALLATFSALLRISRIESGAYRRAFETIDLAPIVRDVAELYHATAEDQLVHIRTHIDPAAKVFGDRELLAQTLTNLIDNALKFTPPGGHIDLELKEQRGRVLLTVADSGPGIPHEHRERVLQRFARLDEARSKPGNGLGLALVRAVCDQHDGKLSLSDNAPGLRVTLSLPPASESDKAALAEKAPGSST
ncbi:MAG: HAMP domain-containing sensor histidine kinase [Gammaproteobacteria bacterium]|nr:HAMP domain-containing sensor histidine kinase [Gammaproteobacteria bacterium]